MNRKTTLCFFCIQVACRPYGHVIAPFFLVLSLFSTFWNGEFFVSPPFHYYSYLITFLKMMQ